MISPSARKCDSCGETVEYSAMDRCYVILYGTCWDCDKKRWEKGELPTSEFEAKETKALEMSISII